MAVKNTESIGMTKIAVEIITIKMEIMPIMSNRVMENATVVIDVTRKIFGPGTAQIHLAREINTCVSTLANKDGT